MLAETVDGNEIKEWYALAAYLRHFGDEGVPGWYAEEDGRKDVSSSWNPAEHLVNLQWITLLIVAAMLAAVMLAVLGARVLVHGRGKKSK